MLLGGGRLSLSLSLSVLSLAVVEMAVAEMAELLVELEEPGTGVAGLRHGRRLPLPVGRRRGGGWWGRCGGGLLGILFLVVGHLRISDRSWKFLRWWDAECVLAGHRHHGGREIQRSGWCRITRGFGVGSEADVEDRISMRWSC